MIASRPAIVLLSGGLDSATVLALAKADGFTPYCLSFEYGQRHAIELDAARAVAAATGVAEHKIARLDLRTFGGSALTDQIDVPKDRPRSDDTVPVTYVPARNTIFLAYALAYAEVRGAADIFLGVNAIDYSGYPDCRPEYIHAFEQLARLATKAGVEGRGLAVHTPLINMTKTEIIRTGLLHDVDYGLTRSCYDPDEDGRGCGHCDSCQLRLAAFAAIDLRDPAPYQHEPPDA
jgi:7-cyano-7-deazaguanine synthase